MLKFVGRSDGRLGFWKALFLAFLAVVAVGCGGSDGDDVVITPPSSDPGASFSIAAPGVVNNKVTLEIGDRLQFGPEGAKWNSSKPEFAAINESGLLEAKAVGESLITATNSNGRASENTVTVTVVAAEFPNRIFVDTQPASVEVGLSGKARVFGVYGANNNVYKDLSSRVNQWVSSVPADVSIEATTGIYKGLRAEGSSEITPVFGDAQLNALVTGQNVLVRASRSELTSLTIKSSFPETGNPRSITVSLAKDGIFTFDAIGTFLGVDVPVAGMDADVSWSSSDSSIAFIDLLGNFVPFKTGTTEIRASRLSKVGGVEISSDPIVVNVVP